MGIAAPFGINAAGLPPLGDRANAVVRGALSAVGPSPPFAIRGPMNLMAWNAINTELTTTAGSLAATVASATGLAAGNAINSVNVPRGATIGALAGTDVTLALPPFTFWCSGFSLSHADIIVPAGANVARLLGATVSVPAPDAEKLAIAGTVTAIVQQDEAPNGVYPGVPGIITLSAAPTIVPPDRSMSARTCSLSYWFARQPNVRR